MASMLDPSTDAFLHPEPFDWADDVEDMLEDTLESSSASSIATESDFIPTPTDTYFSPEFSDLDSNVIGSDGHELISAENPHPKFEYICDDYPEYVRDSIDEDLVPMPLIITTSPSPIDPSASFSQTVETHEEPIDEELEGLLSSVAWEFNWRNNAMRQEPGIHHFNWLGQGMFHRSLTLPEESLAVMLTDPKVPQATEDLRVQSILHRAYSYLDPVVVCLDEEAHPSLRELRGSALQHAAKGRCFKHYTPHGRWHSDPEEPMQQNVLDAGGINNYLNPDVVIGNGFVESGLIPSRGSYRSRWQERLQTAQAGVSQPPSRRERRPSPLRQIESASPPDIQPSVSTHPDGPDHQNQQEPSEPGPSTQPEYELDVIEPSPSTQFEDGSNATEPGPSTSRSMKIKSSQRKPAVIKISEPKPSVSLDPSRDPDVYYSFPTSPFKYKDNKCKRMYKKAKRYIRNKLYLIRASL